MKTVFAPHIGRHVKFGRKPRDPGGVRLHLSDFISHAALPPIPATFSYAAKAAVPLADIYGNDTMGDCVIAAGEHLAAVATGNATGIPYHCTKAQIVAAYQAVGGYVPGDESTDNGCNEQTYFDYLRTHGFSDGTKLIAAISVNASSFSDVLAAAYLFENLFFGVALPDAWVAPFPAGPGFTWGVNGNADPNNGHAFLGIGGTASGPGAGIDIDTWGLLGKITPGAIAAYAGPAGGGGLYTLLTPDILIKAVGKAPNGLAWDELIKAFDTLGGTVPVPAPAPPAPAPAPPAPPPKTMTLTLLQAQLYALDKLHNSRSLFFTKGTAQQLVADSLAMHWVK